MDDVNPFGMKFPRECLAEHAQPRLANGERGEARASAQRRRGAGERDKPVAGFQHVRDRRLSQINGSHHIGIERLANLLGIHFQKTGAPVTTRVMSEDRDWSEIAMDLLNRALGARALRDVGWNHQRFATARTDLFRHRSARIRTARQ